MFFKFIDCFSNLLILTLMAAHRSVQMPLGRCTLELRSYNGIIFVKKATNWATKVES